MGTLRKIKIAVIRMDWHRLGWQALIGSVCGVGSRPGVMNFYGPLEQVLYQVTQHRTGNMETIFHLLYGKYWRWDCQDMQ